MPSVLYLTYPPCSSPPTTTATGRVVQHIADPGGTGILLWTANGGVLPADTIRDFDVFHQGKRLEYLAEYTVTPMSGVGQSTVTILFPIPDTYYVLIGYY